MKALTLTQPWATLVALGLKQIETRSWQTSYRGEIAIHAATGFPKWAKELCYDEPFFSALEPFLTPPAGAKLFTDALPTGCVVAAADLTAIYSTNSRVNLFSVTDLAFNPEDGYNAGTTSQFVLPPPEPERSFGDYSPNRFAWRLENIQPLPEPIPAKGALSLWEWNP